MGLRSFFSELFSAKEFTDLKAKLEEVNGKADQILLTSTALVQGVSSVEAKVDNSQLAVLAQLVGISAQISSIPGGQSPDLTPVLSKLDLVLMPPLQFYAVPPTGKQEDVISIPLFIKAEAANEITDWGLDVAFYEPLFSFVGVDKGLHTLDWSLLDGNVANPGVLTIGGAAGSSRGILGEGLSHFATLKFQVIAAAGEGNVQPFTFQNYVDGFLEAKPNPWTVNFIYKS